MMKMRSGTTASSSGGGGEWELRPGGMVVQRRTDHSSNVPRVIRVRVKYGSVHHEISVNSQSSFGELKKILSEETGVHHQDMKILYKNKERESKMFLDLCGVKDRSKLILKEDLISQEKRILEMRKIAAKEKATKEISDISFEVDRLAGQLSVFDKVISKREKIEEKNLENLMEMMMNQLVKLDAIFGDGDVKLRKKMQEERLHKYVKALDVLKVKSSKNLQPQPQPQTQTQTQTQTHYKEQDLVKLKEEASGKRMPSSLYPPVIITTKWKTFDSNFIAAKAEKVKPVHPKFKWEIFDKAI